MEPLYAVSTLKYKKLKKYNRLNKKKEKDWGTCELIQSLARIWSPLSIIIYYKDKTPNTNQTLRPIGMYISMALLDLFTCCKLNNNINNNKTL